MDSTVDQLIDAAFEGDLDAVERLIAQGTSINAEGRVWNPLHAAIENQQFEVVRFLIHAGADLEFVSNTMTPLAHAVDVIIDGAMQQGRPVVAGPLELIDLLMAAGAQVGPGLKTARDYQCSAIEDHLQRRARSPSDPGT